MYTFAEKSSNVVLTVSICLFLSSKESRTHGGQGCFGIFNLLCFSQDELETNIIPQVVSLA